MLSRLSDKAGHDAVARMGVEPTGTSPSSWPLCRFAYHAISQHDVRGSNPSCLFERQATSPEVERRMQIRAPGESRTRLSTVAGWCLDRSATGASVSGRGGSRTLKGLRLVQVATGCHRLLACPSVSPLGPRLHKRGLAATVTDFLFRVGMAGFEPASSCVRGRRPLQTGPHPEGGTVRVAEAVEHGASAVPPRGRGEKRPRRESNPHVGYPTPGLQPVCLYASAVGHGSQSTRRDSNPHLRLGKAACYHFASQVLLSDLDYQRAGAAEVGSLVASRFFVANA